MSEVCRITDPPFAPLGGFLLRRTWFMTVRKYKKGDRLVYPHHGACTVEKIEKMTAFDVKQDYLKLKVAYTDLVLMVPVANAESVGLRDVINDEEVEEVFAVLRKKEARMPTNWSPRFSPSHDRRGRRRGRRPGSSIRESEAVRISRERNGDQTVARFGPHDH